MLFTSDQTCLTNFSGDKKLWLLFMSISNIRSEIRNKLSSPVWILMGLLSVGPKRNNKVAGFPVKGLEYDALNVQHKIIAHIMLPLTKLCKVRIKYCTGAIASINKIGRQEYQRYCVGMEMLGNTS